MVTSLVTWSLKVGDRIGLSFVVESALLSVLSALALFTWIIYNSVIRKTPEWHFFRSGIDYYIVALLFSDVIQGLGSLLHIRWVNHGIVEIGTYCTVQGVLKQLGDVGVAYFSAAIAVHSMAVIFFKLDRPPSKTFAWFFIFGVWVILVIITTVPSQIHKDPPYYGINGSWCWINPYYGYRYTIGLEYSFLWLSMAAGLVSWGISYLCLQGKIVVEYPDIAPSRGKWNIPSVSWNGNKTTKGAGKMVDGRRPREQREKTGAGPFALPQGYRPQPYGTVVRVQTRDSVESQQRQANSQQKLGEAAWKRLLFPISYIIGIVPLSVVRLIQWRNPSWHNSTATAFAAGLFNASGLINVSLYIYTRPSILNGAPWRKSRVATGADDDTEDGPDAGGRRPAKFRGDMTMPDIAVKSTSSSMEEDPDDDQPDYAYGRGNGYASSPRQNWTDAPKTASEEAPVSAKYRDHDRLGYEMHTRASGSGSSNPSFQPTTPLQRPEEDRTYGRW